MDPQQTALQLLLAGSTDPPDTESDQVGLFLMVALEEVWSRIRALHPKVPAVVLLPAPARRGRLNVLGHFAARRWTSGKIDAKPHHEVVVVAENLDRPAEDIVETLVHEAAHAANFEAGIHDCSASQYHNRAFKAAAEELGLVVEKVPNYGYAHTSMPEVVAGRYRREIDTLRVVLIHRNRPRLQAVPPTGPLTPGGTTGGTLSRSLKAVCACPFIIRVSKQTILGTIIRCESCGQPFRLA